MWVAVLGLILGWGSASASAAQLTTRNELTSTRYVSDTVATSKIGVEMDWSSDSSIDAFAVPTREFHFKSFLETGPKGDYSLDMSPVLLRFAVADFGYFWMGRQNPIQEAASEPQSELRSFHALGASWVQNQSNALSPRVSGWIGAGWRRKLDGTSWSLSGAYSPIFLPSNGPRLLLSENDEATGSRFARLPPLYVDVNDVRVPLRFRVETGAIQEIVLKNQIFLGATFHGSAGDFQLMGWSAPSPDPQVDASGVVRVVSEEEVQVLATAKASFPREYFVGARWMTPRQRVVAPELQAAWEAISKRVSVSASISFFSVFEAGGLHTFEMTGESAEPSDPSAPEITFPSYRKGLVWAEVGHEFSLLRFRPSLRWEQHLTRGQEGSWISPSLRLHPFRNVAFFASASLLAGKDQSYFGTWRSLDSVSLGGSVVW